MAHDALFDSGENRTLLAIGIRKQIKGIGVGGIIWGVFNIVQGLVMMRINSLNIWLVVLGSLMVGAGIRALMNPNRKVLLEEACVGLLLFGWNVTVFVINTQMGANTQPRGLILPLVITIILFQQFRKLGYLNDLIEAVTTADIKTTKALCKALLKKKVKADPALVEAANVRGRIQIMGDRIFIVHRDLLRAFAASRQDVQAALAGDNGKKITLSFAHPLGKLKYEFTKDNAAKVRTWLAAGPEGAAAGRRT